MRILAILVVLALTGSTQAQQWVRTCNNGVCETVMVMPQKYNTAPKKVIRQTPNYKTNSTVRKYDSYSQPYMVQSAPVVQSVPVAQSTKVVGKPAAKPQKVEEFKPSKLIVAPVIEVQSISMGTRLILK